MIDTIPHLVFPKDPEGRYLLANEYLADAVIQTPDQIVGLHAGDVPGVHPEEDGLMQVKAVAPGAGKRVPPLSLEGDSCCGSSSEYACVCRAGNPTQARSVIHSTLKGSCHGNDA